MSTRRRFFVLAATITATLGGSSCRKGGDDRVDSSPLVLRDVFARDTVALVAFADVRAACEEMAAARRPHQRQLDSLRVRLGSAVKILYSRPVRPDSAAADALRRKLNRRIAAIGGEEAFLQAIRMRARAHFVVNPDLGVLIRWPVDLDSAYLVSPSHFGSTQSLPSFQRARRERFQYGLRSRTVVEYHSLGDPCGREKYRRYLMHDSVGGR